MNFLHPAMLFAGVAVGLPVVVHWLTRPRPVRLPLSTVRFVMQAVQQRRARHRLRDWLVLLLRAIAVGFLVWAFARPLFGSRATISPTETADGVRVVVLDQSASMGAVSGGASAFEKARPVAAEYLSAGGSLRANLILAGASARGVFDAPSSNVGALREELGRAGVRPERLNVQSAINLAGEMLAKSDPKHRRELVMVSDFQRSNWASADFSPLPKDTKIELKTVGQGAAAKGNVGILRVGGVGRAEHGRETRVEVEVGNYSPAARDVEVDLTVGKAAYRLKQLCPPGMGTTLSAAVTPSAAGWQVGEAKLANVEDALKEDDRRQFVIDVRPSPTYVLVTREASAPQATSSHFMERALAPVVGRDGRPTGAKVVRVEPAKLERDAVAAADLIVVDHPGKLSQGAANLLAGLMRRGRAVLYVAAESVDATNLKMIAEAAGGEMKMPVEFLPAAAGQVRRGLFIAEMRREEAPFSIFGDSLGAAVGSLRFAGGLSSRRLDGGLADDVLATLSDRSAGIVATTCGAGALGVINADLTGSNLPSSGAFVPIVTEMVARLIGTRADQGSVNCGESMVRMLPADAGGSAGLVIQPSEETGHLVEEGGFVMWRWNAAGSPGVYLVKRSGGTVFAVASGIAKEESDLRAVDATVMRRIAGDREVNFESATSGGEDRNDRAWAWALVAACVCMVLEVGVLKAFGT